MATYDSRPSAFTQLSSTTDWEAFMSMASVLGGAAIDAIVGSAMAISLDTSGRNAVIADGNILIKGQLWRCDAPVSTPVPAASAQNRIDRLVIRLTRGASTSATVVAPAVITGTPSGSPVIPALTQTPTGIWEYPVSHWTSTSAGAIQTLVDDRRFTNDPWHNMRPLQNAFNGTIAGVNPPQYRFSDDCRYVELAGGFSVPDVANNITIAQLPYNYSPKVNNIYLFAAGIPDGVATPLLKIDNTGKLTLQLVPGSGIGGDTCYIYNRFPLDDTNGFLTS